MVREHLEEGGAHILTHIRTSLWLHPPPQHLHTYPRPVPWECVYPVNSIPLLEDAQIGIYSKMIVWNPGVVQDTHFHPMEHCFFTSFHKGLTHIVQGQSDTIEVSHPPRVIHPGRYEYIHDTIGPHRILNTTENVIISYHLYIDERAFPPLCSYDSSENGNVGSSCTGERV